MKVSVIIPTYNRASFIQESINSILNQTYRDLEIIVIDDGSTDTTAEVKKIYGSRINYIRQENKGAGAARNRGLIAAKGKYIAFLDSDDLWFDFKLELQVSIMEKMPEIGFMYTNFIINKEKYKTIKYGLNTWFKKTISWDDIYDNSIFYSSLGMPVLTPQKDFKIFYGNLYYPLLKYPLVPTITAIVRRECITEDIMFAEGIPIYEDWEFFARLSREHIAAFIDIETAINRGHDGDERLTQCSSRTKAESRLELIERVWKADIEFKNKYEKEIKKIEGEQIAEIAKCLLLTSKQKDARKILQKWNNLGLNNGRYYILLLNVLARMPCSIWLINLYRSFRRVLSLKCDGYYSR